MYSSSSSPRKLQHRYRGWIDKLPAAWQEGKASPKLIDHTLTLLTIGLSGQTMFFVLKQASQTNTRSLSASSQVPGSSMASIRATTVNGLLDNTVSPNANGGSSIFDWDGQDIDFEIAKTLEQQMCELSLTIFDVLNRGEFDNPKLNKILAPDFHTTYETDLIPYRSSGSRDEFIQNYIDLIQQGHVFSARESSAKLSDSNRKASVVLNGDSGVCANRGGIRIELVMVLTWERRKEEGWVCSKCKCLKGLAGAPCVSNKPSISGGSVICLKARALVLH